MDYLAFKRARRNDIIHFGVKRRSGRYPWGSGEHPYQSAVDRGLRRQQAQQKRAEARASKTKERAAKNLSIGKERLQNRVDRANALADIDYYSKKIGWDKTLKAARTNEEAIKIKRVANEILESEARTMALGDYTRKARIWNTSLTAAASTGVGVGGTMFLVAAGAPGGFLALPIAGSAAIAAVGYDYFKKSKY